MVYLSFTATNGHSHNVIIYMAEVIIKKLSRKATTSVVENVYHLKQFCSDLSPEKRLKIYFRLFQSMLFIKKQKSKANFQLIFLTEMFWHYKVISANLE